MYKKTSLALMIVFFAFSIKDAYAYVDPGSTSMIIQMMLGVLVGAGIAIKVYWYKLKVFFSSSLKKE